MTLPEIFDVETESRSLKDLLSKFDSDQLMEELFSIMLEIRPPRIPFRPFAALDSPLKQLSYIASLNLTSDPAKVSQGKPSPDEWELIVEGAIKVKAAYYDLFLSQKDDLDKDEFDKYYKVALPVFLNYYDTGVLNYEEQEIERIQRLYAHFDCEMIDKFGLTSNEFINIYELIDEKLKLSLNAPFKILRVDEEARTFFRAHKTNKTPTSKINYDGQNENIRDLIKLGQNPYLRSLINKKDFYDAFDNSKIDRFFELLSIDRRQDDSYIYYTSANRFLLNPIYKRSDGQFLIIEIKQVLYSISSLLHNYFSKDQALQSRYFKRRGNELQKKTMEIFETFFNDETFFYNEYTTVPNGDGQDILVLHKGLALIIESKAGREPEPRRDTIKGFEQIVRNFKRTIQEGYDQAYRVKDLFLYEDEITIYDKNGDLKYRLKTRKIHHVFVLVITQDKFREVQINLPDLLKLNEDDDLFPLSISIDDLEIILLAMKRLNLGTAALIKFLTLRQELQGRLHSNDELDIWGTWLNNPSFSIPAEKQYHFQPSPHAGEVFEELYRKGLGFNSEKNIDEKRSKHWKIIFPHELGRGTK